jgi:hypothetical protein
MLTVSPGWATADEDYSHMVYTATAFMYWCKYKVVPKSVADFARVTDVNKRDSRITQTPEHWFATVQFEIEGEKLKIIRVDKEARKGGFESRYRSVSTSSCESFDPSIR